MTDKIPARFEMATDPKAMTITVGPRVFDKPDLARRPEWDFEFKADICGYPETARNTKVWNKFYAEMLGCKFNFRFFAANYWLWIGNRMTVRTGNMLRCEGRHWQHYNPTLVKRANAVLQYINEAERDGLYNIIPIIIALGEPPQAIRASIGRGAWRLVANNSATRNVLLMNASLRSSRLGGTGRFTSLLDVPSGVMRAIHDAGEIEFIAARITPKKRVQEFRQTLHLVMDTKDMLPRDEFNPNWSYARMRYEHERATKEIMRRKYSPKPFAADWAFEDGGYTAALLTSKADIATEGATQHHCVASYAHMASKGEYAVFKIEGKERATAGVVKGRVQQIYGACNAEVSDDCKAFAHKLAVNYASATRSISQAA